MYIYKIVNNVNKKIYIGQHNSPRKSYWGSGKLIKLAVKKYGKENFSKEIIEYCEDEKNLSDREIFWIKELDTRNKLIGYNISEGGEGYNRHNTNLNKKLSDNHRKHISENHSDVSGEKNPMYGKNHSEIAIEKIRLGRIGTKLSDETKLIKSKQTKGEKNPNSKLTEKIVIEILNEYKNNLSLKKIAIKYGVNEPCIWKIVNRYTWKHLSNL